MQDMEKIYQQHFHTVYRYLCCLTGKDEHLAEELCQETFFQAVKSIHRFRGDCAVSTWLCQIARHVWYHYLEKKRYRKESSLELLYTETPEAVLHSILQQASTPEREVLSHLDVQAVADAMKLLPEAEQEVLSLRLWGELSFQEIGTITGHTENWARVTFFRGKQKVKEALKDEF